MGAHGAYLTSTPLPFLFHKPCEHESRGAWLSHGLHCLLGGAIAGNMHLRTFGYPGMCITLMPPYSDQPHAQNDSEFGVTKQCPCDAERGGGATSASARRVARFGRALSPRDQAGSNARHPYSFVCDVARGVLNATSRSAVLSLRLASHVMCSPVYFERAAGQGLRTSGGRAWAGGPRFAKMWSKCGSLLTTVWRTCVMISRGVFARFGGWPLVVGPNMALREAPHGPTPCQNCHAEARHDMFL